MYKLINLIICYRYYTGTVFVRRKVCICRLAEVLSPQITKRLGLQIANPQSVPSFSDRPPLVLEYVRVPVIILGNVLDCSVYGRGGCELPGLLPGQRYQ
jgi:hypothetical protein